MVQTTQQLAVTKPYAHLRKLYASLDSQLKDSLVKEFLNIPVRFKGATMTDPYSIELFEIRVEALNVEVGRIILTDPEGIKYLVHENKDGKDLERVF